MRTKKEAAPRRWAEESDLDDHSNRQEPRRGRQPNAPAVFDVLRLENEQPAKAANPAARLAASWPASQPRAGQIQRVYEVETRSREEILSGPVMAAALDGGELSQIALIPPYVAFPYIEVAKDPREERPPPGRGVVHRKEGEAGRAWQCQHQRHANGEIYWGSSTRYCGSCGFQKHKDQAAKWPSVQDWDIVEEADAINRRSVGKRGFPLIYDNNAVPGKIAVMKKGKHANTYSVMGSGSHWFNHAAIRLKILVDSSWPQLSEDDRKKLWQRIIRFTNSEGLQQALEVGFGTPNGCTGRLRPPRNQQKQSLAARMTRAGRQRERSPAPSPSKQPKHNALVNISPGALVTKRELSVEEARLPPRSQPQRHAAGSNTPKKQGSIQKQTKLNSKQRFGKKQITKARMLRRWREDREKEKKKAEKAKQKADEEAAIAEEDDRIIIDLTSLPDDAAEELSTTKQVDGLLVQSLLEEGASAQLLAVVRRSTPAPTMTYDFFTAQDWLSPGFIGVLEALIAALLSTATWREESNARVSAATVATAQHWARVVFTKKQAHTQVGFLAWVRENMRALIVDNVTQRSLKRKVGD